MKICQKLLCWQIFFLHLWQNKPSRVELKTNGGVIFITILLDFRYLISLELANTQKSELFFLRIYLGNVNASVVLLADILKFTISVLENNF